MRFRACASAAVSVVLLLFVPSESRARTLTFEERVRAQEAIERVYYAHRLGATTPFEQAVPRDALERKVRTYLKQSLALERFWDTPVTAEMLEREMERMARGTLMPARLQRLHAALGNDPFLIQECLVRPSLVGRLARSFFASDERIHSAERRAALALQRRLKDGLIDRCDERPDRTVRTLVVINAQEDPEARSSVSEKDGEPLRFELSPVEFDRWRHRLPPDIGTIGPVRTDDERFIISVVLDEQPGELSVAHYFVGKRGWEVWWAEMEGGLDEASVRPVASVSNADSQRLSASEAPLESGETQLATDAPCVPDDTWDNGVLDDAPEQRNRHTAVWTGNEMIVWGGTNSYADRNTGYRYDPAIDTWSPISATNAPMPRENHTAVWTGEVMVVWGGYQGDPVYAPTNTGGKYDPLTDTWTPTSTTNAPDARWLHTAVWTGTEMFVWGGAYGAAPGGDLNSGARYNPETDSWWAINANGAPTIRRLHTAVWTGTHMLIWGGERLFYGPYNTGGRYDAGSNTWTPISTGAAPEARHSHTAVWTGSEMIVWGGDSSTEARLSSGGRYDPVVNNWRELSSVGTPPGASEHAALWTGSVMVVWGGSGDSSGAQYDPVSDSWTPTSPTNAPSPRTGPTAVWTDSHMIAWGGTVGPEQFTNTGARYDPAADSWTPTSTAGAPSARIGHTAVWTGNHMIVWGGRVANSYTNTGGRYDPTIDGWTPTSMENAPEARGYHTGVWTGSEVIVWGGEAAAPLPEGKRPVNSGGRYEPFMDTWTPTSAIAAPEPRAGHAVVWTGNEVIVWGGKHLSETVFDTGGRYDPAMDTWKPTSSVGAPLPRTGATAVWTGSRMIIWGGYDLFVPGYYDTGGRYEPGNDTWTPTSLTDAPSGRGGHTAVWSDSEMIVWGGTGSDNIGYRYDPPADTWAPMSITNAPSPRDGHTAVWTGEVMTVWGGDTHNPTTTNTGGRYDPMTDTWMPTSTVGAASRRKHHTAIWTGSFMMVWGGLVPSLLNDGGRYALGHSQDDDGDGLSECAGDCNDDRADVYPSAPEICDGADNDCNGMVDDGFPVPSEMSELSVGSQDLFWSAIPDATSYQIVKGDLVVLIDSGDFGQAWHECLADQTSALSWPHSGSPPMGEAWWYLVRGRNCNALGSFDSDLGNQPTSRDDPLNAVIVCP